MSESDIRTHDLQGRPYIKLSDIKPGTRLQFDAEFGCLIPGRTYTANVEYGVEDPDVWVSCKCGKHFLNEQAEENDGYCIGVYAAPEGE